MNPRSLLHWLLVAVASLGCAPTWHVVSQSTAEAFRDHPSFALMPIDYSGLRVGRLTEDEFLSQKTDQQRRSFAADKVALEERFREGLVAQAREAGVEVLPAVGPGGGRFAIQPSVAFLDPGVDALPTTVPVRVEMRVRIMAADGIVLDEITLSRGTDSHHDFGLPVLTLDPSSGGLLREDGQRLGKALAAYLRTRVGAG